VNVAQLVAVSAIQAEHEAPIRLAIMRGQRSAFGTERMRRTGRCVPLAAAAMLAGKLPPGSVIVCADAFSSCGWNPDMRNRRAWVDLPDGYTWEPVEATTLPTAEHYHRADPQRINRYRTASQIRTALLAAGWKPADRDTFLPACFALISDGIPASGELVWEDRPGLVITEPPPRPAPRRSRFNGLSPQQLAALGVGQAAAADAVGHHPGDNGDDLR
jgi:hypothetical protein